LKMLCFTTLVIASASASADPTADVAQRNAANPFATYSAKALDPLNKGGCYTGSAPSPETLKQSVQLFTFTDEELNAAANKPSIDWRTHGAVGPVQQQHPFGTCWAFSMTAVTEAVNVIQGGNDFVKLSEQMTVSCVPQDADGDNADVLWSWAYHNTDGRYQSEEVYPYNRTCNFYREQQLAPDGTNDGYPMVCNSSASAPFGPCPPCPGITRKDGTPPCHLKKSVGEVQAVTGEKKDKFSTASVQGWGFIGPHGVESSSKSTAGGATVAAPQDVTRMVAALMKYGPAQIGIDASCVEGYTGGIITNCTSNNVDHAVAIVGADTDSNGIDYWLVRNSWNTTFGEGGYFRVQRDTQQMGIFGGYFACYEKDCMVDPALRKF